MFRLDQTIIHCITCEKQTPHAREFHHSGEYLMRCGTCGTWTLAQPPKTSTRYLQGLKRNPVDSEVRQAAKLGEDFSGHRPSKLNRIPVAKRSKVRVAIGPVTGIMYLARRDGKNEQYLHRFAKGCQPSLVVTHDGKQLELIGGSFRFTERGIVDKRCRVNRNLK